MAGTGALLSKSLDKPDLDIPLTTSSTRPQTSTESLSSSSCMSPPPPLQVYELTSAYSPTSNRVRPLILMVEKMSYFLSVDAIRRIFRLLPFRELRRLMRISDIMRRRSQEIISERKEALLQGDQAMLAQVGEGKDLMSICCECCTRYLRYIAHLPIHSEG